MAKFISATFLMLLKNSFKDYYAVYAMDLEFNHWFIVSRSLQYYSCYQRRLAEDGLYDNKLL